MGSLLLLGLIVMLIFSLRFGEVLACSATSTSHLDCKRSQLRMFWADSLTFSDIDPASLNVCVRPNQTGGMEQLCGVVPGGAKVVLLSLPDHDIRYVVKLEDSLKLAAAVPGTAFEFKRSERTHALILITIIALFGAGFAWDVFARKK